MSVKFIKTDSKHISYNKETRVFLLDGSAVPFKTQYRIINPLTQESRLYDFVESTGGEFDANTLWLYANADTKTVLAVTNGTIAEVSMRANLYLKAKLRS